MMGWILIVNAAVFVLQNVLQLFFGIDGLLSGPGPRGGFLPDWFALTMPNLMDFKVWTLGTYSLFHGSLFHLLANFILIFFVGRMVETIVGEQGLLRLYVLSVLCGGIGWALVHWGDPRGMVIGASGGALGILIYFCLRRPNEPITLLLFFVFPVTVLPKWVGWATLGIGLFGLAFNELGPRSDGIAHSAHLGGMLGAFLFYRFEPWFRGLSLPRVRFGGRPNEKSLRPRYRVNLSGEAPAKPAREKQRRDGKGAKDLRGEIDRILDKINAKGFGSLTAEERETLNRAKELLGK